MTERNAERTVIGNISLSLDGRVSGPGGEFDMGWIVPHAISNTSRDNMIAVTSPATTALLGRKNYEGFMAYWPGVADDERADPRDRAFSRWLTSVEKVVFSSTRTGTAENNARFVSGDPAHIVEELRHRSGGDIVALSSSSVIRRLLQADTLDRLSVTLCPEISGGGSRLLDDLPASSWTVQRCSPTETGALCIWYDRRR